MMPCTSRSATWLAAHGFRAVWNLGWSVEIGLQQRVIAASTGPVGIAHLEDPRTLDRIDQKQSDDRVETRRHALDAALVYALDAHRISTGINLAREDVEALNFGTAIDQRRDIVALRAQDEWQAGRHRAVIGGSLTDYEGFGGRVDGSLDYGYDWRDGTRLPSPGRPRHCKGRPEAVGGGSEPAVAAERPVEQHRDGQHQRDRDRRHDVRRPGPRGQRQRDPVSA